MQLNPHDPKLVCGECGSSSNELVQQGIVAFRRCLACRHESLKIDVTTGMPYVTSQEREKQDRLFTNRTSDKPITF